MIESIDHIVIAVRDLAAASDDYQRAGFTVTPGGEHTGGATHNALVSFADGAYLELIAFREPDRPQEHKWWGIFAKGEGTVDFALLASDLQQEANRLRDSANLDGPHDGGRQRPDGQRIAWRSLSLKSPGAPLPFVIEDVTARELRVPTGAATRHPNGATGVAGLSLLVTDLDRAASGFEALLGTAAKPSTSAIAGVRRSLRFPLSLHWIELAEADPGAEDLQQHISERGAGPYEIVLAGPGTAGEGLPANLLHGARIRFAQP